MNLKNIKNKLKAYIEKSILDNSPKCFGTDEKLSEEEIKRILYKIEFADEIIKEYGSIERWEKVMKQSGFKPYLYCNFNEKD